MVVLDSGFSELGGPSNAEVVTLPIYELLIKLIHSYYRRSLQLAYFCDGEDIEFPAAAENPYCPNILLGACISDFRRPDAKLNQVFCSRDQLCCRRLKRPEGL